MYISNHIEYNFIMHVYRVIMASRMAFVSSQSVGNLPHIALNAKATFEHWSLINLPLLTRPFSSSTFFFFSFTFMRSLSYIGIEIRISNATELIIGGKVYTLAQLYSAKCPTSMFQATIKKY